jgi:ABC-type amino acid transport substrate-binding protein
MVIGAVPITGTNLKMLDFSVPYIAVEQLVVKVKTDDSILTLVRERISDIFTIFQPFTLGAWIIILVEVLITMCILLVIEATILKVCCQSCHMMKRNGMLAPGFHGLVDCFYWAFSMSFDPGASGKSPEKAAGRIYIVAHSFFFVIIAASYTGTVGPAIYSRSLGAIKSFDTLKTGQVSVGVVGPRWDSDAKDPPFLGKVVGTFVNLTRNVGDPDPSALLSESVQFKILQTEMKANKAVSFSMITADSMHSMTKDFRPFTHTMEQDPCTSQSTEVRLGIFDLMRCKSVVNKTTIQSTVYDAPRVVFEMMKRYNNTGECSLVAVGERFGSLPYGIGFPKNTSLPHVFSRAIERVKYKGIVERLLREAKVFDLDNTCKEPEQDPESLTVSLLSGLFLLVFSIIFVGLLFSCLARTLSLPCSSLSDKDTRRSVEKDMMRDFIESKVNEADREERRKMKRDQKKNVYMSRDDQLKLMSEKLDDTYRPSYRRPPGQSFTHMAPFQTKQVLLEVQFLFFPPAVYTMVLHLVLRRDSDPVPFCSLSFGGRFTTSANIFMVKFIKICLPVGSC